MMEIMVTQTWAWLHAQLDYPKYKWIKIHALRPNTNHTYSYCGLKNYHDSGDMEIDEFLNNPHACKKCAKSIRRYVK